MSRNAVRAVLFAASALLAMQAGMKHQAAAASTTPEGQRPALAGQVAETRIFRLYNPFPFALEVKVLGNAPSFPQVVKTPAAGYSVPIPYPDLSMRIQIRKLTGGWSPPLTVKWRATGTVLPNF